MTGKLDEISYSIGKLSAAVDGVAKTIDENRHIADARHTDNKSRLDAIERTLNPLQATVEKITPIVEGIQITRWKFIGAMTVGSLFLAGIGWAITLLAGKITSWAISFIR